MLRRFAIKSSLLLSGILPFEFNSEDAVHIDPETVKRSLAERAGETGAQRLQYMFSSDEFGNISPELNSSLQVGFMGLFIGAVYGGFTQSRIAYMNFMENNQATVFKSHLEAKKKLQDQVTLNFGKVSVYRGKSSIIEYLIGGGVTGALYKFSMGPRGMLVGGLLGTCLGAVGGGLSLGLLKLTGMTMEDVRYWQHRFHEERQQKFKKVIKEHKEKEDSLLFKEYKSKREHVKTNLDSIPE